MRPFRFFFALSLGLILFFFLARVFILALILAAVLSVMFLVVKKIRELFQTRYWEDYEYEDYEEDYGYDTELPRYSYRDELILDDYDRSYPPLANVRYIEVK